jgi:hypothetical protein
MGLVKNEATNVRNLLSLGKSFSRGLGNDFLRLGKPNPLALANLEGLPKLNGETYFLV